MPLLKNNLVTRDIPSVLLELLLTQVKFRQWRPTPTNVKEVRGFLGLSGYYRKFIRHYGMISKPLTELLKKGVPFVWSEITDTTFCILKKALVEALVLALPQFDKPFVIETDVCELGIGAVLMQEGHPLAYVSKALGPKNRTLSVYEREYLAILLAVDQWRPYLLFQQFTIRTDQKSLVHLQDQKLHTVWQQKALTKLMGLHYSIVHKKGVENSAADALSRRSHNDQCFHISKAQPVWMDGILDSYASDDKAIEILQALAVSPYARPHFQLIQGLPRYKGCIWIGNDVNLQNKIFSAFHDSPLGGHFGFPVTYHRIHSLFRWTWMKKFLKDKVQSCLVCQQAKPERVKYPSLLSRLSVPHKAWETVTMDFITGLPPSCQFDCIFVVIDKFTKYGHFMPLQHPFTAHKVAEVFLDNVYKLHGMPEYIVSDSDSMFTSTFWQTLTHRTGTQLNMSSAYHLATDGQTERVNQQIEYYLRSFIISHPSKWSEWLSMCEFWYNTNWHSAVWNSPFEVLYGHTPTYFGIAASDTVVPTDIQHWLSDGEVVTASVRQHLLRAQQRMKHLADKNRFERSFEWVNKCFSSCNLTFNLRLFTELSINWHSSFLVPIRSLVR